MKQHNKKIRVKKYEIINNNKNKDEINYQFIDYEEDRRCNNKDSFNGLIIEENTIYEIDEECIRCLRNAKKGISSTMSKPK